MTTKQDLQRKLTNGNLKDVIEILLSAHPTGQLSDSIILTSSRYFKNERDNSLTIISPERYNREYNCIMSNLLQYVNESNVIKGNVSHSNHQTSNSLEDKVKSLLSEHKRTDSKQSLSDLLVRVQGYERSKVESTSYDRSGRIMRSLEEELEEIKEQIQKNNDDESDNFGVQINTLLDQMTYNAFQKAYDMCVARGHSEQSIQESINIRDLNRSVKATIADKIETLARNVI